MIASPAVKARAGASIQWCASWLKKMVKTMNKPRLASRNQP